MWHNYKQEHKNLYNHDRNLLTCAHTKLILRRVLRPWHICDIYDLFASCINLVTYLLTYLLKPNEIISWFRGLLPSRQETNRAYTTASRAYMWQHIRK